MPAIPTFAICIIAPADRILSLLDKPENNRIRFRKRPEEDEPFGRMENGKSNEGGSISCEQRE